MDESRSRGFRGVTVSTLDFESNNPSSNLGGTFTLAFIIKNILIKGVRRTFRKKPRFSFLEIMRFTTHRLPITFTLPLQTVIDHDGGRP
jgi:hypothetical protein